MTQRTLIGWIVAVMFAGLLIASLALLARFAAPHAPMIIPSHYHPFPLGTGQPSIPGVAKSP